MPKPKKPKNQPPPRPNSLNDPAYRERYLKAMAYSKSHEDLFCDELNGPR
jgi:hypothetical protein